MSAFRTIADGGFRREMVCPLWSQSVHCYLPSFQISAASFHSPRTFSHTTRYFPEISFGVGSLVIKLNVPISRAAWGLKRLTSRVVSFGLLTCSARPFHIAPIAALPFTIASRRKCGRVNGVELGNSFKIAFAETIRPILHSPLQFWLSERPQVRPIRPRTQSRVQSCASQTPSIQLRI